MDSSERGTLFGKGETVHLNPAAMRSTEGTGRKRLWLYLVYLIIGAAILSVVSAAVGLYRFKRAEHDLVKARTSKNGQFEDQGIGIQRIRTAAEAVSRKEQMASPAEPRELILPLIPALEKSVDCAKRGGEHCGIPTPGISPTPKPFAPAP